MKSLPAQGSMNNVNGPSRSIAMLVVILFALAGLISGFAVGGFLHFRPGQSATSGSGTTSGGQTTNPPASHTSNPKPLGLPQIINLSNAAEQANDTTTYSLTIQAVNKKNQPVQASDITCKLWLVERIPPGDAKYIIKDSTLKEINTIQNPLTGYVDGQPFEEMSGLTFDSSTPQTHFCDANGRFTWKFQVSSSVVPGNYDLVVLTDWNGVHYNWSWINIDIR